MQSGGHIRRIIPKGATSYFNQWSKPPESCTMDAGQLTHELFVEVGMIESV